MKKIVTIMITLASAAILLFVMHLNISVAGELKYVGTKKCMGCHRVQYKSWQSDYHSKALDDLKAGVKAEEKTKANLDPEKDYTADSSCLECHATGYGKLAAPKAALDNVGCESCHGPGSAYKSPKIKSRKKWKENPEEQRKLAVEAGLIMTPSKESCVACHNDKSPTWNGFEYEKMVEDVKHKK